MSEPRSNLRPHSKEEPNFASGYVSSQNPSDINTSEEFILNSLLLPPPGPHRESELSSNIRHRTD